MTDARNIPADPPVISVIMPVYNAVQTLERAVESVQAQSRTDWELLLIEDGSKDGSADLCASLAAADLRLRLLRQPGNTGAALARNAGIAQARGRFIAFLDSDDEWLPEKLSLQLDFMVQRGAAFSYTGFWRARADQAHHQIHVPASVDRTELLRGNVIGCLTAIYDRSQFQDQSMPELRMRQDFAFWLQLLEHCPRAYGLDEPLAVHHVTDSSLSSPRGRAMRATWRMFRQHLQLSVGQSAYYMASHLLRRLRRG